MFNTQQSVACKLGKNKSEKKTQNYTFFVLLSVNKQASFKFVLSYTLAVRSETQKLKILRSSSFLPSRISVYNNYFTK